MSSPSKSMSPALTSPDPAAIMKSRPKPRSRSPTPPPNGALRNSSRHGAINLFNGEGGAVASSGTRYRTSSLDRGSSAPGGFAGRPGSAIGGGVTEDLLKHTRDGLLMSPALHRARLLSGVVEAEDKVEVMILEKTASSNSLLGPQQQQQQQQLGTDKETKRSLPKGRSRRSLGVGRSKQSGIGVGNDAGVARGMGGEEAKWEDKMEMTLPPISRQITKQRSSTWDEPGVRKYVGERPGENGERLGEGGSRPKSMSMDGLGKGRDPPKPSGWEHLDAFQAMGSMFQQELYHEKASGFMEILSDKMRVPLLIILVGVLGALVGMFVDYCASSARLWRVNLTAAQSGIPFQWVMYTLISLSLLLSMCAITHFYCPTAAGGGVPEIKAVLSGAGRPGLLTPRLVVVKALGVIVANAAGLSVGKEGPLIHITCAIADTLMATDAFRTVRLNTTKRLEVLACACAAGVAATFGSVFGGTLFSVEVTATAYRVNTLPATFFCAVVVAVVYWVTGKAKLLSLLNDDTEQAGDFLAADMIAWCLLGIVCGLVGAGFVAVLSFLSGERNYYLRKTLPEWDRKKRIFAFVALCTILVTPTSMTEAIWFSDPDSVGRQKYRPFVDRMYEQQVFGTSWKLVYLLLLKTWTTIFSVIQPLPLGLFSPVFIIGGLIGRVFGEMAHWANKYIDNVNINFKPWEFALIGSAAFSAGVTRAVSTAVIVFELSGENHLRLPLGVALMISFFIANRFTKGIYDALMDTNGTPYLHEVGPRDCTVPAENVMMPIGELPHLSLGSTGKDASEIVSAGRPGQVIPIVQSMNDKVLVGVVLWNDLAIALADYRHRGTMPFTNRGSSSVEQKRAVESYGSTKAFASVATEREGEEENGDVGPWPRLSSVAKALGKRVGWLPRMRLAEPALLEQLDKEELTSDSELKGENICACREGIRPPLPPAAASGAASGASGVTTNVDDNSSSKAKPLGEDSPLLRVYPSLDDGDEGGPSPQEGASSSDKPRAATKRSKASGSEIERANRAPLRFFLVREGHKFVPVGGNRRKGAWRELPLVHGSHGVPVVLDPSPYQVTHTTELAKVDLAFRLLKVENAYVCNAGRLVGVVTRDSLRSFMETRQISPMDDCLSMFRGFDCCLPPREDYETVDETEGVAKESPVPSPTREQLPDEEGWSSFLRLHNASYSSESDGDSKGLGRLMAWLKPGRSKYSTVVEASEEEDSDWGGMERGFESGRSSRLEWEPL